MEAKDLSHEIANTRTDTKRASMLVESGTTETLDPEGEKKLIRKIDWQ